MKKTKTMNEYAIWENYDPWDFRDHGFICPECGRLHFPSKKYEDNTMVCSNCGTLYAVTAKVTHRDYPNYIWKDTDGLAIVEFCFTKTNVAVGKTFKSKGYRIPLVDGTIATGLTNGRLSAKVNMKKLCRKLSRRDLNVLCKTHAYQSQHSYWYDFTTKANATYVDYNNTYSRMTATETISTIGRFAIPVAIIGAIVAINVLGFRMPGSGFAVASGIIDGCLIFLGMLAMVFAG